MDLKYTRPTSLKSNHCKLKRVIINQLNSGLHSHLNEVPVNVRRRKLASKTKLRFMAGAIDILVVLVSEIKSHKPETYIKHCLNLLTFFGY